jgi:5-methyltetrahydrofolate--homocysteine methyltransferase
MDGAMGSELLQAGAATESCLELWNLTHPEQVRAIHRAYLQAGARVLVSNTFQANPTALARHGRQDELVDLWQTGIELARSAGHRDHFVLASIGPPVPDSWWEPIIPVLAAADGLLLETFSDREVLGCVARHREKLADAPIFLSLTYCHGPQGLATFSGDMPEAFAAGAREAGVTALGVNCGRDIGMADAAGIIRRYRAATDLPLFARPNAGTPARVADTWVYPHTPEIMADRLPDLLAADITLVGGCCGTTPAHIAAFRPVVETWNRRQQRFQKN